MTPTEIRTALQRVRQRLLGSHQYELDVTLLEQVIDSLTALPGETAPASVLANISSVARRALSFGHQATPQTPERMIERKDEALRLIHKMTGVETSVLRDEPAAPDTAAPMPQIQIGDIVTTERGRRLVVDKIERRPANVAASVWQGSTQMLINEASGGTVLDVAVVKIERPVTLWRRGSRTP